MKHFRHWTPEEEERLCALVGTMQIKNIAIELGRTYDSVCHMMKRKGLRNQPPKIFKDDEIEVMREWALTHTSWEGIPLFRTRASVKCKAMNLGIKLQKKERKPRKIKETVDVLPRFDVKDIEQSRYVRNLTKVFAGHTIYEA